MAIDSSKKLIEYCLRKLGAPVINVEIDDTQSKDRVEDAVKFFVARHFDGAEEVLFKKTILPRDVSNGYLTIDGNIVAVVEYLSTDRSSSVEVFDSAQYNFMDEYHRNKKYGTYGILDYYMTQSYINTLNIIVGKPNNSYTFNKATNRFVPADGLTSIGSSNLLGDTVDMGDWVTENSALTVNDLAYIDGELTASTITSSAAGVFGINQTIDTKGYVRGTYTHQVILKSDTYIGNVLLSMEDRNGTVINTETITLDTKWKQFFISGSFDESAINDIVIKIQSSTSAAAAGETFNIQSYPSLFKNNFIVLRGYRAVDMVDDTEIFEDRWLQKYTVALIKQQVGTNLKKYNGQKLPGGIEIDGQTMYDEATTDINALETEFLDMFEMPADILIG